MKRNKELENLRKKVNEKEESLRHTLPSGYRFITNEERDSVFGKSSYLDFYPTFMHEVIRYDNEFGWDKEPSARKYFCDDSVYATYDKGCEP